MFAPIYLRWIWRWCLLGAGFSFWPGPTAISRVDRAQIGRLKYGILKATSNDICGEYAKSFLFLPSILSTVID
jgi:hypothetical protein